MPSSAHTRVSVNASLCARVCGARWLCFKGTAWGALSGSYVLIRWQGLLSPAGLPELLFSCVCSVVPVRPCP